MLLLQISKTCYCFTLCNLAYKYLNLCFTRNRERTKVDLLLFFQLWLIIKRELHAKLISVPGALLLWD